MKRDGREITKEAEETLMSYGSESELKTNIHTHKNPQLTDTVAGCVSSFEMTTVKSLFSLFGHKRSNKNINI